jgi:protein ImuA
MSTILPLAAFARKRSLPPLARAGQGRQWCPGHKLEGPHHAEILASGNEAGGAALALALALEREDAQELRPWLWVQDGTALRRGGRPYAPGLPATLRHRLIHVAAATPEDALFALEEGLRCRDLAFVIGEIAGNPGALGLTASRRLGLAAEKHGTALWLVRLDAVRDLSSARLRWQVRSAPSTPPRWNPVAPGAPAWRAELFRARNHPPGEWILNHDGRVLVASPPHPRDLVPDAGDRSLAAG